MSETAPESKQNIRVDNTVVKYGMSKLEYGKFSLDCDKIPYVVTGSDDLYKTTKITYVQLADIDGTLYVTGSAGKVKSVKEYRTNYDTTNKAKITIMFYEDSENPTSPTTISVDVGDIVEA